MKYSFISSTYVEFLNEFLTSPRGVGESFRPTRPTRTFDFKNANESDV